MKPLILVVDDDAAIAEMLSLVLHGEGFDTIVVGDGLEAVESAREHNPDLVLLDVMLPGMNGVDVCKKIREFSSTPIIMLTARTDTVDIVLGLESGADDYMSKPFKPKELVARVRARLRRTPEDTPEQSGVLKVGHVTIDLRGHQVTSHGKEISLTPMEYNLLRVMASHSGRAFTREELLEEVWGYSKNSDDTRLVTVHMQRLRSKIERPGEEPIVQTVRGVGYKCGE